jgi:subtilisin family serine protease
MQLIVTVPELNKRSQVPPVFPHPETIIGVVLEGFRFEGEQVSLEDIPNPAMGTWYRDRDGYYYWGGGLMEDIEVMAPPMETSPREVTAPTAAPEIDPAKMGWGFKSFGIDKIWSETKGEKIKVALLDSGLNFNLDDFKDNPNISFYNAFNDSENKNDCLDSDITGHGTDCTAILCAKGASFYGVAPDISLVVIKITNQEGGRTIPAFKRGLSKAIDEGADVISISFSLAKTNSNTNDIEDIHQLVKKAYNRNITIVASAGDSGTLSFPINLYPASFPECLSIGGITMNRKRSNSSCRSDFLDLMGPGENITSLFNPALPIKGTSFSTPFVAGVIALFKSHFLTSGKTISNMDLFDFLKRGADRNFSNYNLLEYGWGILDPLSTLNLLENH